MNKFIAVFFVFSLSLLYSAQGLGISGESGLFRLDYQPGYTREYTFDILNGEGYTATYNIEINGVLSDAFTVSPKRIENVKNGESSQLRVNMKMPEETNFSGTVEVIIMVRPDSSSSGVLMAVPSVGIRYLIFIPYPYKMASFQISSPNMNINDSGSINIIAEKLGKPTIEEISSSIAIVDENNVTIRTISTQNEYNISGNQKRTLTAKLDSHGMKPGNYYAKAQVSWDENTTDIESGFRVGNKDLKILNFTKTFKTKAINLLEIMVESGWSTTLSNVYAESKIFDLDTKQEMASFRSASMGVNPWEKTLLKDAYLDTTRLDKKNYLMEVTVNFDGGKSKLADTISIEDTALNPVMDEVPGAFKIDFPKMTTLSMMASLFGLFLIINIFVLFIYFRKKQSVKKEEISPDIVEKIIELRKTMSDKEIGELMIKKGWSKEKTSELLKQK